MNEASHDFSDVIMGSESFPAQFVVTNEGGATSGTIDVSVTGTSSASFVIVPTGDSSDCQGQQLGAGQTCTCRSSTTPPAPGPRPPRST